MMTTLNATASIKSVPNVTKPDAHYLDITEMTSTTARKPKSYVPPHPESADGLGLG
ncbi:hypothetical protein DSUL_60286 [Desulfovibrionales bacterium]